MQMVLMGPAQSNFEYYLQEIENKFKVAQISTDSLDISKMIILDAREREEFKVSHIENAIWIGFDEFDTNRIDSISTKEKVVVYCSVGYRSSLIVKKMLDLGYSDVKNLYGGIFKWANEHRKLVNESTNTIKIHGYSRFWALYLGNSELEIVY
jgi:rhodanese-related sulfurtransferase